MKKYIVEYYKDKKKEFRLRIIHKNGNIILVSAEGYKRRSGLRKSLANVSSALTNLDFEFRDSTLKK